MRCVIAGCSFDLVKSEVQDRMRGVKPEAVTGESVIISRRTYPVKQVGQILTRQDRRDFTAEQITRAMTRLGFTCRPAPEAAAVTATAVLSPLQAAVAMLGTPAYS